MTFREFLQICHPRFWLMNNPYNEETDILVKKAIREGFRKGIVVRGYIFSNNVEITYIDQETQENIIIWVHNYPYGYGTLLGAPVFAKVIPHRSGTNRPSRLTILRLKERVDRYCVYYPEYCL